MSRLKKRSRIIAGASQGSVERLRLIFSTGSPEYCEKVCSLRTRGTQGQLPRETQRGRAATQPTAGEPSDYTVVCVRFRLSARQIQMRGGSQE